jgi:small subunit ribosomal protein S5
MAFNRKPRGNKSEFEESLLDIARVTLVIGNKAKHQVGVGVSKGKDVAQAIQKASNKAKKNLIIVPIINDTIPHEVKAKYKAARVIIKPTKKGMGVRAGGAARIVLKLANVPNANAKILSSSSNAINNARVTILALSKFKNIVSKEKPKEEKLVDKKQQTKNYANSSDKTK